MNETLYFTTVHLSVPLRFDYGRAPKPGPAPRRRRAGRVPQLLVRPRRWLAIA
jgi:hypothetical protein